MNTEDFSRNYSSPLRRMQNCEKKFSRTSRENYAHHQAESLTILPQMTKIPDMKDLALELEVEHSDMKIHFENLMKEGYDLEIWRHRLAPLYDVMHAHWLKEEETMIPFGPEYFSKNEWEDFGKRFDEIIEEYLKNH